MRRLVLPIVTSLLVTACGSDGSSVVGGPDVPVASTVARSTPESTATTTSDPTAGDSVDISDARKPDTYEIVVADGEFVDAARDRRIPYRVYAPLGADGDVPVIVASHGGQGSDRFFRSGSHLGSTFASHGFLAIHVGHLPSSPPGTHRLDRPADVSALLDRLDADTLDLPAGFTGSADTSRVGHTGHSFGAYTSHAVGGATFDRVFTDDRIDAIAPISPQGLGQFAEFDNGPGDTTWSTVTIPSFNLVGGDEIDTNAIGTIDSSGWRLTPFENYPAVGDKYLVVIDGQDHDDMWQFGTDAVKEYIAAQILAFFQVYVEQNDATDPCAIGSGSLDVEYRVDRLVDPAGELVGCDVDQPIEATADAAAWAQRRWST